MIPVIDLSEHQGAVDFKLLRSRGIQGLILRVSHGMTQDKRVDTYYPDALAAGFSPRDIGFYSFINPKRGSGAQCAQATSTFIHKFSNTSFYMLDIEQYINETPNVGTQIPPEQFVPWLKDHISTFKFLNPGMRLIAYSNSSFYDHAVGDLALAQSLDWIVPRYPAYSLAAYIQNPLPTSVNDWKYWAFKLAPKGPNSPLGVKWEGWQFSAGYNRQGAVYGCSSTDLDLNIIDPVAWQRWTKTSIQPPNTKEDTMIRVRFQSYANVFLLGSGGFTHLSGSTNDYFTNLPLVISEDHPQAIKCALHQSGLAESDLVHI